MYSASNIMTPDEQSGTSAPAAITRRMTYQALKDLGVIVFGLGVPEGGPRQISAIVTPMGIGNAGGNVFIDAWVAADVLPQQEGMKGLDMQRVLSLRKLMTITGTLVAQNNVPNTEYEKVYKLCSTVTISKTDFLTALETAFGFTVKEVSGSANSEALVMIPDLGGAGYLVLDCYTNGVSAQFANAEIQTLSN